MTRLLPAVEPDTSIVDALKLMERLGLYHLLVVSDSEVVGILSAVDAARDLIEKVEAAGVVEASDAIRSFLAEPVERIARRPVITVDVGTSLRDIARIMSAHRIGCVPLVHGDIVKEVVCENDVVKALSESSISKPVVEYSTLRVVYVEADATILEALGVMVEGGFRRLPVLVGTGIAGIVTIYQLMLIVAEDPRAIHRPVRDSLLDAVRVDPYMPLSEAAKRLLESKVGAVLLASGGVIVGIFTERDAVRAYAFELGR